MEGDSPEICKICNKSLIEAAILPCAHSFCLECLESSIISKESLCPTCQISFQIPVGGLRELKNNAFVEESKSAEVKLFVCEGCTEAYAVKFCVECSYNYCLTCLEHHKKFPATMNHNLQELDTKPVKTLVEMQYPTCEEHYEIINLYCDDCHVSICAKCLTIKHNIHKIIHISEHFSAMKSDLETETRKHEAFLGEVLKKHKMANKSLHLNMLSAYELKKQVYKRGEDAKNEVDLCIEKLIKTVDEEIKHYEKEAEHVLVKLKDLEMVSRAEIKFLNEVLKHVNYLNIGSTKSSTFKEQIIPDFISNFNIFFHHDENLDKVSLKNLTGTLYKDYQHNMKEMRLDTENSFHKIFRSVASNKDHVFLSYFQIIHVFTIDSMESPKLKFDFKNILCGIYDLLIINDKFIVLDKPCANDNLFRLVKIDIMENSDPLQIFSGSGLRTKHDVISKSYNNDILLALNDKIIHLSENGDVLKTVNLSFVIDQAMQIDDPRYCCFSLDKGIFLIDELGQIIAMYSPSHALDVVKNPVMASDNFGCIYLCSGTGTFVVLDKSLNFVSFHKIGQPIRKICYNEDFNRLIFLTYTIPSKLITLDL